MEIMKEIEKLVSDYKGKSVTLTNASTFTELGFDSLDTVDLMMQIEEKFNITFDDDLAVNTLGELVLKIEQLKKK